MGSAADVERAVAAARAAFPAFAATTREERLDLFARIGAAYKKRYDDMAQAICTEMGAPLKALAAAARPAPGCSTSAPPRRRCRISSSRSPRAAPASCASRSACAADHALELARQPDGLQGGAGAGGGLHDGAQAQRAGAAVGHHPGRDPPRGRRAGGRLQPGERRRRRVGAPLTTHPDVDMLSFTGSTRAGKLVMRAAADGIKKVALELGGKSANIILDDADFPARSPRA
jgi:hypothetical protein